MLKLTKKIYEIEEPVVLNDDKGNIIYEFKIQLTADEINQLKKIMFDENIQEKVRQMQKLEKEEKFDELTKLEKEINLDSQTKLEEFENIVYKENLIPFKEKAGNSYFEEMTDQIYAFFFKRLTDKRLNLVNTMTSNLRKAGMN